MLLMRFVCYVLLLQHVSSTLLERLEEARALVRKELQHMKKRWDINHYPNFLNSPALSKNAWEVMKLRLQDKILAATEEPQQWLVSFMGSSVTAGRDSPINMSFVEWTGRMMAPAFAALDIKFKVTNNAMGNNPCVPYDLCVKAFAGTEADMVHWEQTFNCESTVEMYEQFLRQSLGMPKTPIVIFSNSASENWNKEECAVMPSPHIVTETEKASLKVYNHHRPIELFTHINRMDKHFGHIAKFHNKYRASGIQTFFHADYASYKCLGPYGPDFSCCSAPWHPSLLGHELRAAHHSLLWLYILHDALSELHHKLLSKHGQGVPELRLNVTNHLNIVRDSTLPLSPPLVPSQYADGIQCYTDLETRNDRSSSLRDLVIATKLTTEPGGDAGWEENAYYKRFYDANELRIDLQEGRPDQVICLVGNDKSGMIHFSLNAISKGLVFVCFATGNWGKQPKNFTTYEISGPLIYITRTKSTESARESFVFDVKSTVGGQSATFLRTKEHGEHCVTLLEPVEAGPFVLTVHPQSSKFITVATVLVP